MGYPKYLYEHTNGKIIEKVSNIFINGMTPEDYFDSPFVKRWAKIESEEQEKSFRKIIKG